MLTKQKSLQVFLVALLSLSLVACSTSQVILDIEIASDLVAVSAPIAAAFSGPGAAAVYAYMTAAANGLKCVLTAAETAGATTATIAAAFATCFAQAVVPVLPASTPPQITGIIMAVSVAIKVLVDKYGMKPTVPAAGAARAPANADKVKLTFKDHREISRLRKQVDTALAALAQHK